MRLLRFRPRAAEDLNDIADHIAKDAPLRALSFVDEIEAVCRRLTDHPNAHRARDDVLPGLRQAIFRGYNILYTIEDDAVVIERILHGARLIGPKGAGQA